MTRISIVADSHFDQHSRFEECQRLHAEIRAKAAALGCGATIHTGDLHEGKSSPLERQASFGWVQAMAELGPYLQVRGNHDAHEDLPLLERLSTRHRVTVVQDARVVELVAGVHVAAVAWPRKAQLLAAFGSDSIEAGQRSAADALRSVFRGLGTEMGDRVGARLLAMHAMVRDSVTSTGQPLVGCDLEVGLEDLALLNADAYLLGHVHKPQDWRIGAAPCIYPGSPRRTAFGESERKGFVVVDVDGSGLREWQFVELSATPMVHVSAVWEGDRLLIGEGALDVAGAEVRLRYTTPSDQRPAAAAAAQGLRDSYVAGGALHVKVEPIVLTEQRARAPELARAKTLEEKLAALWSAKGFEPGERREALLGKVRQLEEAHRAA